MAATCPDSGFSLIPADCSQGPVLSTKKVSRHGHPSGNFTGYTSVMQLTVNVQGLERAGKYELTCFTRLGIYDGTFVTKAIIAFPRLRRGFSV